MPEEWIETPPRHVVFWVYADCSYLFFRIGVTTAFRMSSNGALIFGAGFGGRPLPRFCLVDIMHSLHRLMILYHWHLSIRGVFAHKWLTLNLKDVEWALPSA